MAEKNSRHGRHTGIMPDAAARRLRPGGSLLIFQELDVRLDGRVQRDTASRNPYLARK
jgi:hypothetical protein